MKQLFGSKVQQQRLKKNLSQHALTMAGISRQAVSKIELGTYLPPVELCPSFSDRLGLPSDFFYKFYLKSLTSTHKVNNIIKHFIKQNKWAYVFFTIAQYRRIAGTHLDYKQYSLILFKLSLFFYQSKKFLLSARVFELAVFYYNSEDPQELGKLYLRLAKIYVAANRKQNEIETMMKAKDCFMKVDQSCYKQLIFVLGKISSFYYWSRNLDSAKDYLKLIINYANKRNDVLLLSRNYNAISIVYWLDNQVQQALVYIKKSLDLYQEHQLDNEKLYLSIINNQGFYYNELGLYAQGLETLQELIRHKIPPKDLFHTKNELFRIYVNTSEMEAAKETLQYLEQHSDSVSLWEKGLFYRYKAAYVEISEGNLPKAESCLLVSLECFLEIEDTFEARKSMKALKKIKEEMI